MRRAVAGVALALLLIAGLSAYLHYGAHSSQNFGAESATDPAHVAGQVPKGFEGNQQIGDWKLSCGPEQQAPKTRGARPRKEKALPEWKIPRCRVFAALGEARHSNDGIRVTFRKSGLNRTLSIFVRFPPTDVSEHDKVSLRVDKSIHVMTVSHCTQEFCLVREAITKAELSSLPVTKTMSLAFTSKVSGKHVTIPISIVGLADAIRAMLRIDR